MMRSHARSHRIGLVCLLGTLLLIWNGAFAWFASPFVLHHRVDSVQYQLLARNRLHGHDEVGEEAHTVHQEGCHPMWRPGLVWIEEGLAWCLGSVQNGAAAASALGTTLLELALLRLAWFCFGKKTLLMLFIGLAVPAIDFPLLQLVVGQGPEVWAAASIVAGLALLVAGLQQHSASTIVAAGLVAGLAEWFRTGNLLLFAIPCAVYGLAALRQHDRRCLGLSATALGAWIGMAALGEQTVPSAVNKTIVNLWACRTDLRGPFLAEQLPDGTCLTYSLLGYTLLPQSGELYFDAIVRGSRGRSTLKYCYEHAREIGGAYVQRLQQVLTSGFGGLRLRIDELVLALFGIEFLLSLAGYDPAACHTFALGGAALGHYFGPVILIAGNEPTHYVLVACPFFLIVAVRGAALLFEVSFAAWQRRRTARIAPLRPVAWGITVVMLGMLAFSAICFHRQALSWLADLHRQAVQQQAAVDALRLEGRKVACRNMGWFVDRDVQTVFLPYATVSELERYVSAQRIDGILVWEQEPLIVLRATPYGSLSEFGRALQESPVFGPPQSSDGWRWYPVRHPQDTEGQP
jgi:hypothetical protein